MHSLATSRLRAGKPKPRPVSGRTAQLRHRLGHCRKLGTDPAFQPAAFRGAAFPSLPPTRSTPAYAVCGCIRFPAWAWPCLSWRCLNGFAFQPITSMFVILSCLPIMIIHTLAVSASSYRLVRRVQTQNGRLEELSRIDALTGLYDARPLGNAWPTAALRKMAGIRSRRDDGSSTLITSRKSMTSHGHAIGDDVLRAIADLIRRNHARSAAMPVASAATNLPSCCPIRLATPNRPPNASSQPCNSSNFANANHLRCSVSIGIAGTPPAECRFARLDRTRRSRPLPGKAGGSQSRGHQPDEPRRSVIEHDDLADRRRAGRVDRSLR